MNLTPTQKRNMKAALLAALVTGESDAQLIASRVVAFGHHFTSATMDPLLRELVADGLVVSREERSRTLYRLPNREIELTYKRGFDAGIDHQKKANPPPKAHELAKQLEAARDAAAEALDSALLAFGQVQEQLAAVTEQRDDLLWALKLTCARLARVDGGDSMTIANALDAIANVGEEFDVEAFIAAEDVAEGGR